ncbi:hypothetical protein BpHYR1_011602 [Brachionus plicatilis]|uniref:Uncharacterized protein n=1 Tax=Brachionus plicatilis TaxID=10195 RepID=A0A3M7S2P1_BRAPC|nr:hypothetical protein BpHYR1_011602 [Brachionus plicatilis]
MSVQNSDLEVLLIQKLGAEAVFSYEKKIARQFKPNPKKCKDKIRYLVDKTGKQLINEGDIPGKKVKYKSKYDLYLKIRDLIQKYENYNTNFFNMTIM